MATITHTITTAPTNFPAGTTITKVVATLKNFVTSAVFGTVNMAADNTVTFTGVPPGTWTVSAQAYNGTTPLGTAINSNAITVQDPPVSLAIPSGFGSPTVTA